MSSGSTSAPSGCCGARLVVRLAIHQRAQQSVGHIRITIRRSDGGILLALDNEPTPVAGIAQDVDDTREVDASFSRRAERAVHYRLQKTPAAVARHCRDLRPDIFAVDVHDACDVL